MQNLRRNKLRSCEISLPLFQVYTAILCASAFKGIGVYLLFQYFLNNGGRV